MDVRVSRMSRGMRQKLGIVLALAPAPDLLILDEPTSGLDPLVQETLLRTLREIAGCGHTVLFSSHRLSEVDRLCDRVAFIRHGRIVADESLADLRQRAGRAVTLDFLDEGASARARPPEGMRLRRREATRWYADLEGPPADLLRWMAAQPLRDFTVGPPDLDALFQRLYEAGAGNGGQGDGAGRSAP
jgi:ABC-2 type transport system ATP-binding protein